MESAPPAKKKRDPKKVMLALVVAGILLSVAAIGYVLVTGAGASHATSTRAIENGDSVTLNYIGRLSDGRVFDTSLVDVANDNGRYPKSLTFTLRTNDSYTPFTMTAGNYGSGGTIKGFALGVIGMQVNQTRFIEVPPGDGYPVDSSMIKTIDIVQEIPATEVMTVSQFRNAFQTDPILMQTLPHFFWGWDVLVAFNDGGMVTIKHEPVVGQTVYPFGNPNDLSSPQGWPVVVESFDPNGFNGSGMTTVRHVISPSDVYNVKGMGADGNSFILSGYNATAGTFQIHESNSQSGYNGELAGRTLIFEVTIVSIKALSI
jgi:FKBP-type peptidyl-prolyl cis-trans isomerase 2